MKGSTNSFVIENFKKDEEMMILIFAQWCINHGINPHDLYKRAYQELSHNDALKSAIEKTVPKEEADVIEDEVVLEVLQIFGNTDLAFVVQEEIEKREKE